MLLLLLAGYGIATPVTVTTEHVFVVRQRQRSITRRARTRTFIIRKRR
jgi:hypothetical protein